MTDRGAPLTLHETAALVGGYHWLETALFEVLGGWVVDVAEPEVRVLLGEHSGHHGWHAGLWEERLPVLWDRPAAELVVAPPVLGRVVEALRSPVDGAPSGAGPTLTRLVGAYRVVLPRAIAAYRGHLARASAVADGPVVRVLRLVVRDEVDDLLAGEAMIQALLTTPEAVDAAAAEQARLERLALVAPTAAPLTPSSPDPEQ